MEFADLIEKVLLCVFALGFCLYAFAKESAEDAVSVWIGP